MTAPYKTETPYNVYFASALGKVKIGCSRQPMERLLAVSEWVPFPVTMLATMPGTYALEAALHRMFAEEWSHGEWFTMSPRLAVFIERIANGLPVEIVQRDLALEMDARRLSIAEKKRIGRRFYDLPEALQHRLRQVRQGVPIPRDLLAEVHAVIATLPPLPKQRRINRKAA